METISITERPYRPGDLEALVRLFADSVHALAGTHYSKDQLNAWAPRVPDLNRWAERFAGLQTIVAEVGGSPAGFISYTRSGYIDFAFTAPRQARSGIATRLFRRAEATLRAEGVSRLTVHASLAARAFFERMGFVVDQEEMVECRGMSLCRFAMSKCIATARPPIAAS